MTPTNNDRRPVAPAPLLWAAAAGLLLAPDNGGAAPARPAPTSEIAPAGLLSGPHATALLEAFCRRADYDGFPDYASLVTGR